MKKKWEKCLKQNKNKEANKTGKKGAKDKKIKKR